MEEPYVLAKLHQSASTTRQNVYAGLTLTGTGCSSREVVTAVDAQGLNIYNVR